MAMEQVQLGTLTLEQVCLEREIENFLYDEAELLDTRHFEDWLDLLTEDIRYWMPMRRNIKFDHQEHEETREQQDMNWFDEGKETLTQRVKQILTGVHWAEEPLSRVCHMVSNVQIKKVLPSLDDPREVETRCRFLVYQNRVEYETYTFVGKRTDVLRMTDDGWRIARREIILDQNILLAKNLSVFF